VTAGTERGHPDDDQRAAETLGETADSGAAGDEHGPATDLPDDPGEADARGHDEHVVAERTYAKNAIIGSHLSIAGDLVLGESDRVAVPIADITGAMDHAADSFAAPQCYAQLLEALRRPTVILLAGLACGKRTAAGVALRLAGHSPVLLLPSDLATRRLVGNIAKACEKYPTAGIVVEAVDASTVVGLTNFEVHRLTSAMSKGARVVLTASSLRGVPEQLDELVVIACEPPAPGDVIGAAAAEDEQKGRALEALDLLGDRVWPPGDVLALLKRAEDPTRSPEQLARAFDSQATAGALDDWFRTSRSAEHVAYLTAAATIDGGPSVDVDAAADALLNLLETRTDAPDEGAKMFHVADRGWPDGIVAITERDAGTHFGYHPVESVEICAPHTRARIIEYLWRRLGADFRQPLIEWLSELAEHPSSRVRNGAAITAGVLFTVDPIVAERELIRPWALERQFSKRLCAAIALGTPVAIGRDPAGARALTSTWSSSPNLQLKHVAVLAYGGLLGAWDPASAAPSHLWQLGADTPELEHTADVSIASLMAAGPSAARVRDAVLGMLRAQQEIERAPKRVYALLPLIIEHLTKPSNLARESLRALTESLDEREALASLGSLLATSLVSAVGAERARAALVVLLDAVGRGCVEQQLALRLLRTARDAASHDGTQQAFDSRLRRALSTSARARDTTSDAARAMLSEFYPADKEQPLGAH
jgi:hypothetical protein